MTCDPEALEIDAAWADLAAATRWPVPPVLQNRVDQYRMIYKVHLGASHTPPTATVACIRAVLAEVLAGNEWQLEEIVLGLGGLPADDRLVLLEELVGAAGIRCPTCSTVSHHPDDIRVGYCARCHTWHMDTTRRRT